ncbi:DEAD/DEAH box helicase [Salipaludibacillus aurantiacus]|uniref:ATP-dependent RNA helicase DbpA n=1 Tax=Salipaludibacillus aurantiacus TaxID=1601833 RepID=A0A1H9SKS4_9BACI|nr:DEAD/DEAH box helicase [Salipaludibacillus aurantiacus]SER85616.1 Superfamily II DNA and RNA helicase [Salipaludibacillus aurantiacus]
MNTDTFNKFGLSEEIKRALKDLNYQHPTEVQEKVIPSALKKKDLVVKSQTGSGKTASFGIPVCELAEWEENKPQALILTPTRELAVQIKEDITNIGRFKRIKATVLIGQQPLKNQQLELKQKTHVVIGTPGRVYDHILKGTLLLDNIKFTVIDEADEMLNMGFIDQVESIIKELPQNRVTSLYSATIPEDVEELTRKYMNNPIEIAAKETGETMEHIAHSFIEVTNENKLSMLKNISIVENPDSCIVFCNTQERVDDVLSFLNQSGYSCEKIHGGMTQGDRFSVMNEFKRGEFRYLIATNVAARGIDIEDISLVINYDMPYEKESYVHRTGRTGRAGKKGKAVTFYTEEESPGIGEIERFTGLSINTACPPSEAEVTKHRQAFAAKMSKQAPLKKDKSAQLNENITKLYFNGGKQKKLRPVDFVGTLTNIQGISADDIGIISIQERMTYIDILNGKGPAVLQEMKNRTVKGKKLKVHIARK